jgi:hypothetical protein
MNSITVHVEDIKLEEYLSIYYPDWNTAQGKDYTGSIKTTPYTHWISSKGKKLDVICRLISIPHVQFSLPEICDSFAPSSGFENEMTSFLNHRESWAEIVHGQCRYLDFNKRDGRWFEFALRMNTEFEASWIDGFGDIEKAGALEFLKGLGFFDQGQRSVPVMLGIASKGPLDEACWHRLERD